MKINNSDDIIQIIRNSSVNMNFDEYSNSTGISKEHIFKILKGEIEEVDEETKRKLSLR